MLHSHTIHVYGVFTSILSVDVYGFHVGKMYTTKHESL